MTVKRRGIILYEIKLKYVHEVRQLSELECNELNAISYKLFYFSIKSFVLRKSYIIGCKDKDDLSKWISNFFLVHRIQDILKGCHIKPRSDLFSYEFETQKQRSRQAKTTARARGEQRSRFGLIQVFVLLKKRI